MCWGCSYTDLNYMGTLSRQGAKLGMYLHTYVCMYFSEMVCYFIKSHQTLQFSRVYQCNRVLPRATNVLLRPPKVLLRPSKVLRRASKVLLRPPKVFWRASEVLRRASKVLRMA